MNNMIILFKNAHIVNPATHDDRIADIRIVDGIIEKIGAALPYDKNTTAIDLGGKIFCPGFIDMHVHLREPGFEYKETIQTGIASAANGGFTAVCCMPNTQPAIDTATTVRYIFEKAKNHAVDVYPIGAVTQGREGKALSPLMELAEAGAVGFSDDGSPVADAEVMRRALEYASMINKPIIQHAEEPSLSKGGVMNEGFYSTKLGMSPIPSIAEEIMIARDLQLVAYTKSLYHVAHISTKGSVDLLRSAKRTLRNVSCEVTPHHFTWTEEEVCSFDTNTKMNPPLRSREDVEAIKEALRDGTIDVIATDHAPHSFDEKQVEYTYAPFGIVGLETAVGLAMTELVQKNILSIAGLIEKCAINPRKILRIPGVNIVEGEKANATIIDPEAEWIADPDKFKSKGRNTLVAGKRMKGKPFAILNNGIFIQTEL
jgi:dihydroorotase